MVAKDSIILCNTLDKQHLLLNANHEEIKNGVMPFNLLWFPELADTQTFLVGSYLSLFKQLIIHDSVISQTIRVIKFLLR